MSMRRCKHCGELYDPKEGSSVWCDSNPNRGKGANRVRKRWGSRIVTLGVIMLKPNPWVKA